MSTRDSIEKPGRTGSSSPTTAVDLARKSAVLSNMTDSIETSRMGYQNESSSPLLQPVDQVSRTSDSDSRFNLSESSSGKTGSSPTPTLGLTIGPAVLSNMTDSIETSRMGYQNESSLPLLQPVDQVSRTSHSDSRFNLSESRNTLTQVSGMTTKGSGASDGNSNARFQFASDIRITPSSSTSSSGVIPLLSKQQGIELKGDASLDAKRVLVKRLIDLEDFVEKSTELLPDDDAPELQDLTAFKSRFHSHMEKIKEGSAILPVKGKRPTREPEPVLVPQLFCDKMSELGSTTPLMWLNEKVISVSDISKDKGRLNLPTFETLLAFLRFEEMNLLNEMPPDGSKKDWSKKAVEVTVVDPSGETTVMELKNWSGKLILTGANWKKFVATFKLQPQDKLQIWYFRDIITKMLYFAINHLREDNAQSSVNPSVAH